MSYKRDPVWNGSRGVRGGTLPRKVPPGKFLHHNHVIHGPGWGVGINGFRAWIAPKCFPGFVRCPCGWAGLKHYALKDHVECYRNPTEMKRMQRWVRSEEKRWGGWGGPF
jgi:hypothetical protein